LAFGPPWSRTTKTCLQTKLPRHEVKAFLETFADVFKASVELYFVRAGKGWLIEGRRPKVIRLVWDQYAKMLYLVNPVVREVGHSSVPKEVEYLPGHEDYFSHKRLPAQRGKGCRAMEEAVQGIFEIEEAAGVECNIARRKPADAGDDEWNEDSTVVFGFGLHTLLRRTTVYCVL